MPKILLSLFILFTIPATMTYTAYSQSSDNFPNGFDITKSLIPKEDILSGGPPRDGIPAILEPRFERAPESNWLNDDDLVAGVDYAGVQKAYPIRILVWHEAVNDEINGTPVLVTYCPLCGSTLVFSRTFGDRVLTFGISGLKILPYSLVTWKEWRTKYPWTLVLSRDTGFNRDYGRDPYSGYESSGSLMFPIKNISERYHPKEKVVVIISGDVAKAYPFSELDKAQTPLEDRVGDKDVVISFENGNFMEATDKSGNRIESFVSYWFAWYTFRPDTLVYNNE